MSIPDLKSTVCFLRIHYTEVASLLPTIFIDEKGIARTQATQLFEYFFKNESAPLLLRGFCV